MHINFNSLESFRFEFEWRNMCILTICLGGKAAGFFFFRARLLILKSKGMRVYRTQPNTQTLEIPLKAIWKKSALYITLSGALFLYLAYNTEWKRSWPGRSLTITVLDLYVLWKWWATTTASIFSLGYLFAQSHQSANWLRTWIVILFNVFGLLLLFSFFFCISFSFCPVANLNESISVLVSVCVFVSICEFIEYTHTHTLSDIFFSILFVVRLCTFISDTRIYFVLYTKAVVDVIFSLLGFFFCYGFFPPCLLHTRTHIDINKINSICYCVSEMPDW